MCKKISGHFGSRAGQSGKRGPKGQKEERTPEQQMRSTEPTKTRASRRIVLRLAFYLTASLICENEVRHPTVGPKVAKRVPLRE